MYFQEFTVSDLKKEISIKCAVQVHEQRLLYGGKELRETDSEGKVMRMKDYGVHDGNTLFLVLRLPGGN